MIINREILDTLELDFLRKRGQIYFTGELLPGNTGTQLGSLAAKFSDLYVRNLHADNLSYGGTTVDTVDGFHASSVPGPNRLLALNASSVFPASVYPAALLRTGGTLTGNLNAAAGVLIDGVDINLFKAAYDAHVAGGDGLQVHDHLSESQGGDLLQFAHANGAGTRAAHIAERLRKRVTAGDGLLGGGLLDQDVSLRVRTGEGLQISAGALVLSTPGSLHVDSANTAAGNHTHAVMASSDVSEAALLKSDASGGLRLNRLGIGSAAIPGAGNIHASGVVTGNQIVSEVDAFVGNDLHVGEDVLITRRVDGAVAVNPSSTGPVGALTVQTRRASQRGVVVQGAVGQENTAPLFTAANADGDDLLLVRPDGTVESGNPAFVSGQHGWRISGEGDAEFRNINARGELHTSVFVANEMHAAGGTLAVMPTGVVDSPIAVDDNLVGSTFNLVISGSQAIAGVCPFAENDVLRIKLITGLEEN